VRFSSVNLCGEVLGVDAAMGVPAFVSHSGRPSETRRQGAEGGEAGGSTEQPRRLGAQTRSAAPASCSLGPSTHSSAAPILYKHVLDSGLLRHCGTREPLDEGGS